MWLRVLLYLRHREKKTHGCSHALLMTNSVGKLVSVIVLVFVSTVGPIATVSSLQTTP